MSVAKASKANKAKFIQTNLLENVKPSWIKIPLKENKKN